MHVTFCNINKRTNSTKQVTSEQLAAGAVYDNVVLKQLTNIDNPTLIIDGADDDIYTYNYAYIQEWGRYYFVRTCDLRHDKIFVCNLELDDLATYKTQILATTAYIIYSSSNFNRWIRDDRPLIVSRPPETVITHSDPKVGDNVLFDNDQVSPVVILCTASQETGLTYWKMSKSAVDHLLDSLTRAGASVWGALQEQFGDALGSMISALVLPINSLAIPIDTATDIYLGSYHVQDGSASYIQASPIGQNYLLSRGRCGIPTGYLDYRVFEPYSRLRLRLPFVGLVDISHQDFSGSVYYECLINLRDGKIIWTLYNDEDHNKAIATYSGQCGQYLPLVSSQIPNAFGVIEGVSKGVLSLGETMVNPVGLAGSVLSLAASFAHSYERTYTVIGSYSGGISEIINKRVEVILEKMQTNIEPDNLVNIEGRPKMEVDTLTNYTGYIRTQGFSIELQTNKYVIDSINGKLDAGIYIE